MAECFDRAALWDSVRIGEIHRDLVDDLLGVISS
jgi:hypothetical protein